MLPPFAASTVMPESKVTASKTMPSIFFMMYASLENELMYAKPVPPVTICRRHSAAGEDICEFWSRAAGYSMRPLTRELITLQFWVGGGPFGSHVRE